MMRSEESKLNKIKTNEPVGFLYKPIKIAIDGPSGVGKSTTAENLAARLGYNRIDSGTLYRCVTYIILEELLSKKIDHGDDYIITEDVILKDSEVISSISMEINENTIGFKFHDKNGVLVKKVIEKKFLKNSYIDKNVSIVAKQEFIRRIVLLIQRNIIEKTKNGIIIDGRDIGTVVMPEAEIKIFLTASVEVRAKRRFNENAKINKDDQLTKEEKYECILEGIKKRDFEDTNRKFAPLKKADDAVVVDNGNMTLEQQTDFIFHLIIAKLEENK